MKNTVTVSKAKKEKYWQFEKVAKSRMEGNIRLSNIKTLTLILCRIAQKSFRIGS